ncbi:MAG: isoamylase early set domain-containing protein [Thermodesulfobacteriota bacterium]
MEEKMGNKPVPDGEEDLALEDPGLEALARAVAGLPEEEPPAGLVQAVLASLPRRRAPLWRRLHRWAVSPRTFTLTPFQLLPAAAALALLLVLTPLYLVGTRGPAGTGTPAGGRLVTVVFTLDKPQAESVQVIGSFNLWNPKEYNMKRDARTGLWELEVNLPAGRYEYQFLIDGKTPVPDPRAEFTMDDGFGHKNSVIIVGNGWSV